MPENEEKESKLDQSQYDLYSWRIQALEADIQDIYKKSETQEERIRKLEEYKMEIKGELLLIKKELSDQKSLSIELNMRINDKLDSTLAKVLEGQESYLNKFVEHQTKQLSDKTKQIEVDKKVKEQRLIFWSAIVSAASAILVTIFGILAKIYLHI
jgi:hypothetical protein